jgi:hypothetical protein
MSVKEAMTKSPAITRLHVFPGDRREEEDRNHGNAEHRQRIRRLKIFRSAGERAVGRTSA